ncbi:MAG: response regulator transcription factor [Rhodothermales bacterium]|nr:response regulator transcription factor [Rhodothermales bacterium]
MTASILIVEDDPFIRQGLEIAQLKAGYSVHTAPSAEEGRVAVEEASPDLLILDLMLPGRSGLELCRSLRASGNDIPILMLTALADESDRVLGFDLGADDYVTKPFSLKELVARVRALLRRSGHGEAADSLDEITFGQATVNFKQFTATKSGESVRLPAKAFGLLRTLVERGGDVLTREELLEEVWGFEAMPTTRTVDNHVAMLRAALEVEPSEPRHILTVHGVGYRFVGES